MQPRGRTGTVAPKPPTDTYLPTYPRCATIYLPTYGVMYLTSQLATLATLATLA